LVSEGGTSPYRLKIRGPSFCNLSVLPVVARNCLLADVTALLGSLDIVMGEVDR
jgi:NADH-quinone oxidoreductase subunit D